MMKVFFLLMPYLFAIAAQSQTDSTMPANKPDTGKRIKKAAPKPSLTLKPDTVIAFIDTAKQKSDSLKTNINDSVKTDTTQLNNYKLLQQFPIINNKPPVYLITSFKQIVNKDFLFYILLGNVFILALIQIIFPRYFKNIFSIFFQTKFRQNQTKEQLSQDNVASFLLNILFVLSGSTFIAIINQVFEVTAFTYWKTFLIAVFLLSGTYLVKLLFTRFMGWVFNRSDMVGSYNFLVFIVNKIIGVSLLPFMFLLAFSTHYLQQLAFTSSIIFISFLFLFRLFSTYKNLHRALKITALHFFLYFCAVEILPLLLMYKAVSNYINNGLFF